MIRTFEKKQDLFEEIVAYFYANTDVISVLNQKGAPSIVFYSDDTRKEGADARLEELLDATKLERVGRWRTIFPGGIYLRYATSKDISISSTNKGFMYLPEAPQPSDLTKSLDNLPELPLSPLYRHLQGNWYLYIQHID